MGVVSAIIGFSVLGLSSI
ncbi:hypothetical protein EFS45_05275 [Lactobacillus crispatus]|nr:hypothetical protein [Lactobacillus crispatus]